MKGDIGLSLVELILALRAGKVVFFIKSLGFGSDVWVSIWRTVCDGNSYIPGTSTSTYMYRCELYSVNCSNTSRLD